MMYYWKLIWERKHTHAQEMLSVEVSSYKKKKKINIRREDRIND